MIENAIEKTGMTNLILKAGITIGKEQHRSERNGRNLSVAIFTEYTNFGKTIRQRCEMEIDEDFNTERIEVQNESHFGLETYGLVVSGNEAHFTVNQEPTDPEYEGKKIDQILVWEPRCLVIPSYNAFQPLAYLVEKYDLKKTGVQKVACGVVPKVVFEIEYLGDDLVDCEGRQVPFRKFRLYPAPEEGISAFWWNKEEQLFRFAAAQGMLVVQSSEFGVACA